MAAGALAAFAGIFGGVIGAFGALQEGEAEAKAAEFNAKIADENAKTSAYQAAEEERRYRIFSRKEIASMQGAYAASGVAANSATATDVLAESVRNAEMDALTIRYAGKLQKQKYRNEAVLYRMGGKAAKDAAEFRAASSLLGGGSQAASNFANFYGK